MSSTATAGDATVQGYARAVLSVAQAEGALERVEEELFRFARAFEGNDELRDRLVDPAVDAGAKLGVITDLLGDRAHPQTVSAVSYIVQAGRARLLPQIADAVVAQAAETRSQAFAQVRSAVPLNDEQQRRLREALGRVAGREVSMKVVVDPDVVGGLVATIGDTVIDGSVARRIGALKSQLTGT